MFHKLHLVKFDLSTEPLKLAHLKPLKLNGISVEQIHRGDCTELRISSEMFQHTAAHTAIGLGGIALKSESGHREGYECGGSV